MFVEDGNFLPKINTQKWYENKTCHQRWLKVVNHDQHWPRWPIRVVWLEWIHLVECQCKTHVLGVWSKVAKSDVYFDVLPCRVVHHHEVNYAIPRESSSYLGRAPSQYKLPKHLPQCNHNLIENTNQHQMLTLLKLSVFLSLMSVSTPTPSVFQDFHIRLQTSSSNPLQLPADAPFISAQSPHPSMLTS